MTGELKESSRRVADAAMAFGLKIGIVRHAQSTRTAEEAAAACGTEVARIVKSLVFRGRDSGVPVLLLVSGANRVDEAAAMAVAGEPLERPDGRFVREVTGFAIGGIPPFGHATPMKTLIDRDLVGHTTVWAAAGTPDTVFEISPSELVRVTGGTVVQVC